MNVVEHKLDEPIEIVRLLAKPNKKIRPDGLLFKYKTTAKPGSTKDYRCKVFTTVTEVCVGLGTVDRGTVIIRCKEGCMHPIVAFDLCTECGKDLKGEEREEKEKGVAVLHSIPQVSVSEKEASELGMSDILHNLKSRKLTLVVDLDQTIIHTSTTESIPEGIPGVFHFNLSNKKFRYSTRLRPGTEAFLRDMSSLYQMHVFTMGARDYADAITAYLDPDRKYFSSRILSRDECFDNHSKVPKLASLFPKGDRMVVIIDDRFDMWMNCNNLIRVTPYNFFEDVGDINDPNSRHSKHKKHIVSGQSDAAQFKKNKPLDLEQTSFCFSTAQNNISYVDTTPLKKNGSIDSRKVFDTLKTLLLDGNFELALLHLKRVSEHLKKNSNSEESSVDQNSSVDREDSMDTQENVDAPSTTPASSPTPSTLSPSETTSASSPSENKVVSGEDYEAIIRDMISEPDQVKAMSQFYVQHIENGPERRAERDRIRKSSPLFKLYSNKSDQDQDRYLDNLGRLLKSIHTKFYEDYVETKELDQLPDTRTIVPGLRGVLKGCHIVFSGIIPTNFTNPHNHPIWCAANQLGATVSMTLVKTEDKRTTHLVTARSDTGKVNQAVKCGIKIVNEHWLWRCFQIWEKVPTDPFEWKGLLGGKRVKSPEPATILAELSSEINKAIGEDKLALMNSEVDDILANGSDSDYSSPTDSEDSSDCDSAMESNHLSGPPGDTCKKRKRSRSEMGPEEEEEHIRSCSEGDADGEGYGSDNSMEAELMDELEAELSEQLKDAVQGNWITSDRI